MNKLTLDKRDELIKTKLLKYYEDNIEAELKLFQPYKAMDQKAPRLLQISKRPPKGTRDKVIARASKIFKLKPSQIDNIWQKYRRLAKSI